jgi:hypothetical protein
MTSAPTPCRPVGSKQRAKGIATRQPDDAAGFGCLGGPVFGLGSGSSDDDLRESGRDDVCRLTVIFSGTDTPVTSSHTTKPSLMPLFITDFPLCETRPACRNRCQQRVSKTHPRKLLTVS